MLWGRRRGDGTIVAVANRWSAPMPQPNDLSRSLVALDQDSTIIAVVEMSQSSWLVGDLLRIIFWMVCGDRRLEHSVLGELAGRSCGRCSRIPRLHAEAVAQHLSWRRKR